MARNTITNSATGLEDVRVVFDMPSATFDALENDIPDVLETVYDAALICELIATGIATGAIIPDEPGLMSILRMSGKTLRSVRETQGASLDTLDTLFRQARAKRATEKLATMREEAA